MELRELKARGREVMVAYTCSRCGAQVFYPLKDMLEKESYGYLHNTKLPNGWHEVNSSLLCHDCSEAFARFMKGEVHSQQVTSREVLL